jgi:hypothetical protein
MYAEREFNLKSYLMYLRGQYFTNKMGDYILAQKEQVTIFLVYLKKDMLSAH